MIPFVFLIGWRMWSTLNDNQSVARVAPQYANCVRFVYITFDLDLH